MSRLTKFQLNQLSTFIYLKFSANDKETMGSILQKLLNNDCRLMEENLLKNRLYSDDIEADKKVEYPAFQHGYDLSNKKSWKNFLENMKKDKILCNYDIVSLTDKSETYLDEYKDYNKENSGYKAVGLYHRKNNDFVYVIRGTNGDLQWLDNCKAISEYLTKVEREGLVDFNECLKKISSYNPTITLAGHSKGGLTAMALGALINKDVKVSTLFAPFLNLRILENLLKIPENKLWEHKDKLDIFMELFYPIEIHVADIVGGLFLEKEILIEYKEKFAIVGDFKNNGWNFLKNHEPIHQVQNQNYSDSGNPILTKDSEDFIFLILALNKEVLSHDDKIVYPFLVSLFKEIGLLGSSSPKGFYENNDLLRISYEEQFKKNAHLMEFSFDSMKKNVIQWRETCDLIFDIFTNNEIFMSLENLLKEEESCILNTKICFNKKKIIKKIIDEIIEYSEKNNFSRNRTVIIELLVEILGVVF